MAARGGSPVDERDLADLPPVVQDDLPTPRVDVLLALRREDDEVVDVPADGGFPGVEGVHGDAAVGVEAQVDRTVVDLDVVDAEAVQRA